MKIITSFIPSAPALLLNWLMNLQAKLSIHGITLEMTSSSAIPATWPASCTAAEPP
jgi:hypothetical protein